MVKSGRTHLMDATPVTLGQEFGGYAAAVGTGRRAGARSLARVGELPLGGTAVGTGMNAPDGFAPGVIAKLAADLDLPLTEARNHFEAAGARDALVEASGMLRTVAVSLYKICNDLRLMTSGPRTGLAEIVVPDLQPGLVDHAGQGQPGDLRGGLPGRRAGHRERRGGRVRRRGGQLRAEHDDAGDRAEPAVLDPAARRRLPCCSPTAAWPGSPPSWRGYAGTRNPRPRSSPRSIATSGYEAAAEVAHEALDTGQTIKDVVIARGYVARGDITEEQLDRALDVLRMTHPG